MCCGKGERKSKAASHQLRKRSAWLSGESYPGEIFEQRAIEHRGFALITKGVLGCVARPPAQPHGPIREAKDVTSEMAAVIRARLGTYQRSHANELGLR